MGNVQTAVRAYDQPWRPASGDLVELGRTLRLPLGQLRLQRTPVSGLKRSDKLALGLLVLVLHGAVAYWVSHQPTPELPVIPPKIPPMTIEFA
ncbi:energy transducer TonB, partial [Pseudomonas mosselii]|nr:energy transducer TonB [Pseudomonas mosselii]